MIPTSIYITFHPNIKEYILFLEAHVNEKLLPRQWVALAKLGRSIAEDNTTQLTEHGEGELVPT